MTFADAQAVRDLDGDDREIAVSGWFNQPAHTMRCRAPSEEEANNPLQPWCERQPSLTERPKGIGAVLIAHVDGLDMSWTPRFPQVGDSMPVEVVLIGHFDDRRARLCPPDAVQPCRDVFVVDRVARVGGVEQPLSHQTWVSGAAPGDSLETVLGVVSNVSPGSDVLSVVTADRESIGRIEPELDYVPDPGFDASFYIPIKWIVRVLQGDRLETYVVWDDMDIVWQMTEDGPIRIGRALRRPPSPGPWPPSGSVVVELTSEVGGDEPVQVAVIDRSGRLIAAGEKGSVDPWFGFEGMAYAEPGFPGRVHLSWGGGVCDSHVVVTVAPDLRRMTLDTGPRGSCDTMGVSREVVLDFSGIVDVPTIDIVKVPIRD